MIVRTMQSREAGVEKSHDCISGPHPIRGDHDTGRKEDCRTLGRKEMVLAGMCSLRALVLASDPLGVIYREFGPCKLRIETSKA
jgi:hypothetical protein